MAASAVVATATAVVLGAHPKHGYMPKKRQGRSITINQIPPYHNNSILYPPLESAEGTAGSPLGYILNRLPPFFLYFNPRNLDQIINSTPHFFRDVKLRFA